MLLVGSIGLWFRFCLSLVKNAVSILDKDGEKSGTLCDPSLQSRQLARFDMIAGVGAFRPLRRINRIAISTVVTLGVWRIITLKAVWLAAGESGDRILTAILLFVSASWVISLVWICFSKSKQREIPAALPGHCANPDPPDQLAQRRADHCAFAAWHADCQFSERDLHRSILGASEPALI